MGLEDETGRLDVIIPPQLHENKREIINGNGTTGCSGSGRCMLSTARKGLRAGPAPLALVSLGYSSPTRLQSRWRTTGSPVGWDGEQRLPLWLSAPWSPDGLES